ncbi:hypothetical protein [Desulforhopalus vacuolatus]|nr:hypothetical protein [Desulforhopalus vacuolatus]
MKECVHYWNSGEQEKQHGAAAEQAVESEGNGIIENAGEQAGSL